MSKELKSILRNAAKGATLRNDVWEAYIDLPKHGGSIAVYRINKDEAVKIRQIILDALHAYGKEEDPEAWREEYRKKQAAGVMFERRWMDGTWHFGVYDFNGPEKDYREVPQPLPHAAERALWKAQREAGTNEVWEEQASDKNGCWWDLEFEPEWIPKHRYRVKPMKLTAKIVRNIPMTFREYETRLHDWEFFGTREEYIAECEKYGYFVTGKIKEVGQVKPKTVKRYMAMLKDKVGQSYAFAHSSREEIEAHAKLWDITIIGDIEEREV